MNELVGQVSDNKYGHWSITEIYLIVSSMIATHVPADKHAVESLAVIANTLLV